MSDFVFKLNREGVRELLQSPETQDVLISFADQVSSRAGEGYSVHVGPNRANVSVVADTDEAVADNLDHNTLEKSIR